MAGKLKAGVIGCGNISHAYFKATQKLEDLEISACADLNAAAAKERAEEYAIRPMSVDELLADSSISIVINLTTPQAHVDVNLKALAAGKHVHCEKPFGVNLDEAKKVMTAIEETGLRVSCAPDTFFGGGHQTCRKLIDDGWIGKPVAGTAFMMGHGHESWHPSPDFYYLKGGGPMLDMGPYYLTALVNLFGPVKSVSAMTRRTFEERVASSKGNEGRRLPVEVSTHQAGSLEFHNGAIVTVIMSFDVWHHAMPFIEAHGETGSLSVPNPNAFGGPVKVFRPGMKAWEDVPLTHGYNDNFRGLGAADLARAAQAGREPRCDAKLAFHVLEVMLAFDAASETGRRIDIESYVERPAALPMNLREGELD